jgi:very-long-chain (3R)-3-hydroxyacyl-CoA dehydratase
MAGPTRTQGAAAGTSPKAKRRQPLIITAYLFLYNVASFVAWGSVLVTLVSHLTGYDIKLPVHEPPTQIEATLIQAQDIAHRLLALLVKYVPFLAPLVSTQTRIRSQVPDELQPLWARAASAYSVVGDQTRIVQTGAVAEVVHTILGFVRSGFVTTLMQVGSRLQLVWGIANRFPETQTNPVYASMVLAWSITEVIRYPFYAFSLLGFEPYPLLWLRYTTFWILYPLGATSEAILIYSTLPKTSPLDGTWTPDELFRGFCFIIWWPSLYVLYTHMIKQRRKIIGGSNLGKKKTQ